MGGGRGRGSNRSRTQRKHFREGRDNVWKRSKSDPSGDDEHKETWQPFATQNPAFDEYYKQQGIVSPDEWDSFVHSLRTPLPAAFRINSSSQFSEDLKLQLENDFMKSLHTEGPDGDTQVEAVKPLPWYPNNLAWHSNFSRMQLRKNQTLERFHEFLKLENEIGNITRQEAVSMVPPLFLNVRPEHSVLDMCAAPGSKTFQLLEIIYQSTKPGSLPDGMVIANDLDVQRCNLLIHQTKRMCTANLIVTNNEAQHFPSCRPNKNCSNDSEVECGLQFDQLLFDRVLCDVPCSGDGTLRKAPDMWRKWNSGMGNGLHSLQIQIAMRGISLLKVGGRMVYSTCSMNPVENEAVVGEILRKFGGSVELIDVSNEFPLLIRRPGLRKWKVWDKNLWLGSHKDVSKLHTSGILPSMFPSGSSQVAPTVKDPKHETAEIMDCEEWSQAMKDPVTLPEGGMDEEISELPLQRCMRILPHDQNSGAFFIAVLQKISPLPASQIIPGRQKNLFSKKVELQCKLPHQALENGDGLELDSEELAGKRHPVSASKVDLIVNESDKSSVELHSSNTSDKNVVEKVDVGTDSGKAVGKRKLQVQGNWKGVDPVIFFKDEAIINSIKTFYGVDESFPFNGHLISRNSDNNHVKRIYYISKSVKNVLQLNFLAGQQLKIASVGLKMFERQSSREGTSAPCAFRISSEGLPVILPHITKQILHASPLDFKHLLQYKTIKFADFVDTEFGENASKLMMGCCVIVLKDSKTLSAHIQVDAATIAIGCWRGRSSLSVMVTAIDCQELLERLSVQTNAEKNSLAQGSHNHQVMNRVDKAEEVGITELATAS